MSSLESLIARAEALLVRLEAVLPHAATAPDWSASVAYRYRKRGSVGALEPVRHVATIRLAVVNHLHSRGVSTAALMVGSWFDQQITDARKGE